MLRINVLGGLYVTGEGRTLSGAAAQPRRLALLAILAVAGDRGATRDTLLAYLWPDADEERGRRALTQALYALRRDLGAEDALLGNKDLRLNPELVSTDLGEFQAAVAAGALERAVECYRGPFLEGFNLPGANAFERWLEERRAALAHEHRDLLRRLAEQSRSRGNLAVEIGWWRRLAALDPLNGQVALRLMQSLSDAGDVAGALQHARIYEALVQQELDLPPDEALVQLAQRLRQGSTRPPGRSESAEGEISTTAGDEISERPEPAPRPMAIPVTLSPVSPTPSYSPVRATSGWAMIRSSSGPIAAPLPSRDASAPAHRLMWAVGIAMVCLLALLAVRGWSDRSSAAGVAPARVVAVGRIAHYAKDGPGPLGQPLADMLATNLARIGELRVVSHVRMVELMRQVGHDGDSTAAAAAAARQAGATELVDGALYDVAPAVLRLDLRRVDLVSGGVIEAYTVQGPDLFSVADSGTSRLAGDLGASRPEGSLADVSTRSVVAYQLYEEGLRTFYQGDRAKAERLFARALAADSGFAMAEFYYAQSLTQGTRADYFHRLSRALVLADQASDRERLLIRATWALVNSSPSLRAIAETLTVRYPAELDGYLMAGQAAILAGQYDRAHAPLRRVIAGDSLGLSGRAVRCLACEALSALVTSYVEEDSLPAAVRVGTEWTRLQPGSAQPWQLLAVLLGQTGHVDDGFRALRVADSLRPKAVDAWRSVGALDLMGGRYAEAAELARVQTKTGVASERNEARWFLTIVYRDEGRLREALEVAKQYRSAGAETASPGAAPGTAILEAQVLFEQGQFKEAAALFDSIGRIVTESEDRSGAARRRVWTWAHVATALAAAGDTGRLPRLADSMAELGQLSAFERDRRLHHYVRGLLAAARGRHEEAVQALTAAIVSPNMGYTRINYALAGELLTLHRPFEAIPILQSALRGAFEGSNLYLTHTDAAERLAHAFEAAGQRDSAAVYYAQVARAWENSDGTFTPRHLEARGKAMLMLERR